jgi:hypothetical protein
MAAFDYIGVDVHQTHVSVGLAARDLDDECDGVLRKAAHVLEAELGRDVHAAAASVSSAQGTEQRIRTRPEYG